VATIDPEHLFQQAARLITSQSGRLRQADIRRAFSAAYYGLFHAIITAASDQFVGKTNRDKNLYGLVYRSVDHGRLRELCNQVRNCPLPDKLKPYAPPKGFDADIRAFAAATVQLQEERHVADYDVMVRVTRTNAKSAIDMARTALARFNRADQTQREAFLSLLIFRPR
jgi:uncharacterized protein (UPF0332 family)